jgi:hypothetical protein
MGEQDLDTMAERCRRTTEQEDAGALADDHGPIVAASIRR